MESGIFMLKKNIIKMKKLLSIIMVLMVFSFISCNGGKSNESGTDTSAIDDAVLQVKIGDNRTQVGEKLTSQGYKWEDDNVGITVKEKFQYDDNYFDKVVFTIFDAKVFFTAVTNTYYSEKEAINAFEKYDSKYTSTYAKFKTNKTNEQCLKYSEYDDNNINLSIMLVHNEKEDVPALFQDEETLKAAKEHWDVTITYNKSGMI